MILYIKKTELSQSYLVVDPFEKTLLEQTSLDLRDYVPYVPKKDLFALYDRAKKYEESLLMVVELLRTDTSLSERAKAVLGTAINSIEGDSVNYVSKI